MIPPVFDEIANNKTNREVMNLNSIESIIQKLNFYRGYFGKIHDLPLDEFEKLKQNISTFFNLKPMASAAELPGFLVRISNNNRILAGKGKELNYLTEIDELLAPPLILHFWQM
jgi:hypothetical protein